VPCFALFMLVMSVPAQQKHSAKRTGKRITFFSDQAPPKIQEPVIQDITPEPQQPSDPLQAPPPPEPPLQSQTQLQSQGQLRRSRRLSKEGGAPSDNPFLSVCSDQSGPENGARDVQGAPTGVIQSTRRKRRVSQEVNLEMLAQEASERKSPSLSKRHRDKRLQKRTECSEFPPTALQFKAQPVTRSSILLLGKS
ncbi:hypothetical protein XENOCAPTIV_021902, partial [Xenoophorus captivus]